MIISMKKYFIVTFGCQMNEAESGNYAGILKAVGWGETTELQQADVVVINTCSVRQASEDKVFGLALKFKGKTVGEPPLAILTGCMVGSAAGDRRRIELGDLKRRLPWVDYFVESHRLPEFLLRVICDVDPQAATEIISRGPAKLTREGFAYLPIMSGCDNFCSYCVVPYARGEENSRSAKEILKEVQGLVGRGVKEIMLLGQNVNSYWDEKKDLGFAGLLQQVHAVEELETISFMTSNPWGFTDEMIAALKLPKVKKYLHLPVQSGDNAILRKMNRPYTVEGYCNLVARIREAVPGIELGTDTIVGFPGETEEQFENTYRLCAEVGFVCNYVAMYSPRPGTAAAGLPDDVPREIKRQRHARLLALVDKPQRNC